VLLKISILLIGCFGVFRPCYTKHVAQNDVPVGHTQLTPGLADRIANLLMERNRFAGARSAVDK
jgi:hypothetical protein